MDFVSAAAGAVTLFVAQQVGGFLLKDWSERHKDSLRRAMNVKLLMLLLDIVVLASLVWMIFELFNNPKPATRQDILLGLLFQTLLIVVFMNTLDDLVRWARSVWRPEASQASSTPVALSPPLRGRRRKP